MAKSSKIYSYIFVVLGACALFAAALVRGAPKKLENRLLEEIEVVVYVDKSASGEDLKNFREEIADRGFFSVREVKTSARALRELKEDEVIAERLKGVEWKFSPPHSVTLGIENLEERNLSRRLSEMAGMPGVEHVAAPGEVISGASEFLKRTQSVSVFLTVAFAAVAVLLMFTASLFYYLGVSEVIRMGTDTGSSPVKILSPGLKSQFFAGLLGGIFASGIFYAASLFYNINIFSYKTAVWVTGSAGILSLTAFALICLVCLRE